MKRTETSFDHGMVRGLDARADRIPSPRPLTLWPWRDWRPYWAFMVSRPMLDSCAMRLAMRQSRAEMTLFALRDTFLAFVQST